MRPDAADKMRDARLRFAILRLLDSVRAIPTGMRGRRVKDTINGANLSDSFTDDDHLLRLLMDLSDESFIELLDRREYRDEGYGLDMLDCRLLSRGRRFLAGEEPPDGLIDDGRLKKN